MEEWKEYKLERICSLSAGGDAPKVYVRHPSKEMIYPVYSNGESSNGLYGYTNYYKIEAPAVTISARGNIGFVCYRKENFVPIVRLITAKANEEIISNEFLYYCLLNTHIWGDGSVQKQLTVPMISEYILKIPSQNDQDKVVSILSSLDDKIELNRRINENLEAQAQALFKSWFVDFEPFRDGEFVESEMGMIPKGWRVGRYEELIDSTISGDWGKEKPEGNYTHEVACIRGCDFQDIKNGLRGKTPVRYILEKNYQAKHFRDKDILVEISGGTQTVSTGRVCPVSQMLIDKFNQDIVCTNFCRLLRPVLKYAAYLYYSWLYKYNMKVMFGYENGTSGIKNFRIKDFISIEPVLIPQDDVLERFQSIVDSIQVQIQTRGSESSRLATLRDTLLPRLMSGEIKVGDVTL